MNKFPLAAASKVVTVLYSVVLCTTVAAQGVSSSSTPNNEALTLLLDQNRQLQAEVQSLRAMVEELGFDLRRLERDSMSRYTNMDERLQDLENNSAPAVAGGAPPFNPGSTTPPITAPSNNMPATTPPGNRNSGAGIAASTAPIATTNTSASNRDNRRTLQPAVLSEQQLYQMAYDSVINNNFQQSIAEFDQYLSVYPEGRFLTNAHYWKGQAYFYLNRYAEARESYEIILDQYPESPKLPDAMYGLAQAYLGLGNQSQ
ncbi:MAG: tetratricopeptide repeat protein, partial [Gammaproteobacteria bacterium]